MSRWNPTDDDDQWSEDLTPNATCTDCGQDYSKADADPTSWCDGCSDRRDAWATALELTMAQARLRVPAVGVLEVALEPVDPGAALAPVLEVRIAQLPAAVDRHAPAAGMRPDARADWLASLQTLSAVQASRVGQSFPKGKTRIEAYINDRPAVKMNEKTFRAEVWTRDQYCCRACLRKVTRTIARVPERGEIHHIHGRAGDLRWDTRSAILLCLADHERVTGRVNTSRIVIVPSTTYTTVHGTYTDAGYPVLFRGAA